jgi:hypothetical protein
MPSPDRRKARIDRESVVRRHRVELTDLDPVSPVSVGNGELCLTVDVTGLQTFPDAYPVADPGGGAAGTLLATQAQWGWHSTPAPEGAELVRALRPYRTWRGEVPYVDSPPGCAGCGPTRTGSTSPGSAWSWWTGPITACPRAVTWARAGRCSTRGPGSSRARSRWPGGGCG